MTQQYISVYIDAKDSKRFRRRMQQRLRPIIIKILVDCANATYVPAIKNEIVQQGLVFKGKMLNSVAVRPSIGFSARVGVFDTPYAEVVQAGRPHRPSPQERWKMIEWVVAKGKAYTEEDAKHVARTILKKIEREGARPRPFMDAAINSANSEFHRMFMEQFKREVADKIAIK